jgi:hypothetical protein
VELLELVQRRLATDRPEAVLASERGDAGLLRDAGARQHDNVLGLLEEVHCIVDRIVPRQLRALGQLAAEGEAQQGVVSLIVGAVQEVGRADAKGSEQLLGRDQAGTDGPLAKDGGANGPQKLAEFGGLVGGAGVGVCGKR